MEKLMAMAVPVKSIAAVVVLAAAYWLVTHQLNTRYEQGLDAGRREGRESCTAEREAWAEKIVQLERAARETERQHAMVVAGIAESNAEKLREIEHAKNADIADLRRGNLRLREGFRACANSLSADTAAAGGIHETSGDGFSDRTQEHILGIGAACNRVTANLHSLQAWAHEAMRVSRAAGP